MLVKDILLSARYALSDMTSSRWTDARLISLLNDCVKDIAKRTILFTEVMYVGINNLVVDYDLAEHAVKMHRYEYDDKPLPLYTFEEMDKKNPNWQKDTGNEPEAIIYNKQNQGQFKIYPIVENSQSDNIIFTQQYGIITAISYSDLQILVTGTYGDLGSYTDTGYLKIFYTKKHTKLIDVNEALDLDDLTLDLITNYVAGNALMDNADVQNKDLGMLKLKKYEDSIEDYSIEKSKNYGPQTYETGYNSI